MSHVIKHNQPCPRTTECGSSDAYQLYSDGHGWCFSCKTYFKPARKSGGSYDGPHYEREEIPHSQQRIPWRLLNTKALALYNVTIMCDEEGEPFATHYPWPEGEQQIKYHDPANSRRYQQLDAPGHGTLFGMDVWPKACAKAITITEGAADAIALCQAFDLKYPVVAVHSASTAERDAKDCFNYLNSFEKIYLCLDNDKHGQEAAAAIAKLFDLRKVHYVDLGDRKDAHEFIEAGDEEALTNAWWRASIYKPKGIINSFEEIATALERGTIEKIADYPFPSLNELTQGISGEEFILVTAETGIGKTEITRAIEYHILNTTELKLASIRIEEPEERSIRGIVGYHMKKPLHLADNTTSNEKILDAYRSLVGSEDRLFFYTHYGSDDPEVFLDSIRYLVTVNGCDVVVLDHISKIVSGAYQDDERKTLDYLATSLDTMVHDLGFTLICVSHVNDDGKTRGSRNIAQSANTHIHLYRDKSDDQDDEIIRNATRVVLRKNRDGALTGAAGILFFDLDTFMVTEDKTRLTEYNQHLRSQEVPF